MKKTATIILNRNLPAVTDALYERLEKNNRDETDIYIVESGSSKGNLSKYYSWWANWEESLEYGLRYPRGFNYALVQLLQEDKYQKYDYFFLVCNDVEFEDKPIISTLEAEMKQHPQVGILSPCCEDWGEYKLLSANDTKYFWYINHVAWFVRRQYIDTVRELESPSYMNFLYDGENFRGYESEIELVIKGYINDWASAITTKVMAKEDKSHLINKADLIKTDPYEESIMKCVAEGKKWMRRKYGFNSRWAMQLYAKFFYEKFFDYYPGLERYKI